MITSLQYPDKTENLNNDQWIEFKLVNNVMKEIEKDKGLVISVEPQKHVGYDDNFDQTSVPELKVYSIYTKIKWNGRWFTKHFALCD